MTIPAVAHIQIGLSALGREDPKSVAAELAELRFARVPSSDEAYAVFPAGASDFEKGYLLGLETARSIVATMPAAVKAGVSI